jgi:hypothetical protein
MKSFRTLLGFVLLVLPFATWAQDDVPGPPPPRPGELTAGPVIAGQLPPDAPPPPGPVVFRARTAGGPENATFMPLMNPEPGMGLGAWWKNSETVAKLQLPEDRVKKIEQTFLNHKLKLIDLQADLEKQELRLQPLLDVDHPDEGKVGAQIDLITAARGKLEKENAMMMLAIRSELTVEQWKKLKSLEGTERGKQNFFYWQGNGPPPGGMNMPGPFFLQRSGAMPNKSPGPPQ